ncbi:putative uncharacterized protein DDB_G0282133 [Calliphora vicina]|uniref:putative uncharacterized protein DDB_G0282133 n=1 Tax=Calliphora vicina TaxID=7373 RepID=UPI00325A60D5
MDTTNMKTQIKRRISFSGKNSVRVFHGEEEPKTWNNSYEISDHLNVNETASNLGAPSMNKNPRSSLKKKENNKENIVQSTTKQQEMQMEINYHQQNVLPISNNLSILSATKDLINVSYQNQNSKMHHIENSVDITLYDREMQFQMEQNNAGEETNNLYSFSLEDHEKEARSTIFGERTVDFMRELRGDSSNLRDVSEICDIKSVTVFTEYMDEDQYLDFTCTKGKNAKEPITIYMNDSLSISSNEQDSASNRKANNKRKTIQQATDMHLSPNMAKQYDKENVNPVSTRNTNETQNDCFEMEINEEIFSQPKTNDVNVEKETIAFHEKLNRLSFLQESDDNMQIDHSLHTRNRDPNIKSRPTININETIEMSPKDTLSKNKTNSRQTITFNQPIEISPESKCINPQRNKPRKSINFNKTIELSPINVNIKPEYNFFPKDKSRQTINFNKSMEVDSQIGTVAECSQHGAIPKVKARPTINFNQPIETSPPKVKSNLPRQTINLNEDICESPVKLIQDPVSANSLNAPASISKQGQLPKLVVRKICAPLVNKTKNPIDLEQQRMLRYKKKREQKVQTGNVKDVESVAIATKNSPKADKSLNFSLNNVKNMSMSSESSSPLIPSEFKAFNLKQLNDEIEHGKINVFANVPKTPNTDRKARNAASNFHSKHDQLSQPSTKQRRTLVFEDVDIPISTDDTMNKNSKTVKSNNYFDFNITQDVVVIQDRKNNAKYRYSQADDLMLDNTSFLTRAKLSDETVSRNSSKREVTQLNDIMDLFDESLRDAASKLDKGLPGSSVKNKKLCYDTLSSMFQNAKPIFTQTITNIKECNNFIDAYDIMDISNDVESCKFKKHGQNVDSNIHHKVQTIYLNDNKESCDNTNICNNINNKNQNDIHDSQSATSICANNEMENDYNYGQDMEKQQQISVEKSTRQTILFNNDIEEQDPIKKQISSRQTLCLSEDVDQDLNNQNKGRLGKCARQTTYINTNIDESFNTDAKKENSIKSTILYGHDDFHVDIDDKPIGITMHCEDEHINMQDNVVNNRQIQTLYFNEDIADDMVSDEANHQLQEHVNVKNSHEISEESIKPRRHTAYFGDDNIIDENLVMANELENLGNLKNQQSLMYHQDINLDGTIAIQSLEKSSNQIENNIETDQMDMSISNSKPMRKTLYFNNEIPLEKETIIIENNIGTDQRDINICNSKPMRKTLYFNNEIPLEKESIQLVKNVEEENTKTGICNSNSMRKTLYFNNEISFEAESIETEKNIEAAKHDTFIGNSKTTRKTLHFNNDICELDETKAQTVDHHLCKKVSQSRKSIHIAQDMEVTLNELMPEVEDKSDPPCPNNDQSMERTLDATISNKADTKTGMPPRRKSIYTVECMDLDEQENNAIVNESQVSTKLHNADDFIMDLSLDVGQPIQSTPEEEDEVENVSKESKELSLSENDHPNKEKRKTLYFDDNNEMSLDQTFTPAESYQFSEPAEPINAAKMTLARHISSNLLIHKSKITNKQENAPMTPVKFSGSNSNNRLFFMTPRLSLLEFTAAEKKAREEEFNSPLRNENTNKRLPVNLTPVLSIPKKRQTLLFDDCLMDESDTSPPIVSPIEQANDIEEPIKQVPFDLSKHTITNECSIEKSLSSNEQANDMEDTMRQDPFDLSNRAISNHAMEMSGIVSNESELQTPTKQRKSRIPIPISSGKKSNKSFSLLQTSGENHKETDAKQMDGDNLAESIQFMRRATTFTQMRDTTIRATDLDGEIVPDRKPSIFEGNPITISDVTVFFEAQRKSNSLDPQTVNSLCLEQNEMSGLNAIENAKKSLENRYLNLTLEDIEKTRLSLVRISYEDHENNYAEDISPPIEAVASEDIENNTDWKNKRQSVNYLRNVSAVCRKCKRCQDTVLNETTSSASESFVLPALPPLPDLGLDRLRRLRKRPAIADVNFLWQRVSLDRTIINPLNISDDDSQIIVDVDETEDEFSPVTQCISNYKRDMLSFEMELLGKQQNDAFSEKLPFVLRLDALLSINSTNWIFDFQMQCRGILLFTHKQMFTFSVLLTFDEIDPLGHQISIKSVKLEKGHVMEKNWKAIDFVLDFQLKLNLPFDIQSLCEGNDEAGIVKMLQTIDRVCLDTIKMGNHLQRISFANQASIIRDGFRSYVRKIIRKIVNGTDVDLKYVEKTEVKVELLNLKKLSFKDIATPPLHHFREEIHLLPTGLQFLHEFLPNPLNYINHH